MPTLVRESRLVSRQRNSGLRLHENRERRRRAGSQHGLGIGFNEWACTRDNLTGLVWEVKTPTSSSLRYQGWSYVWYLTDPAINGGHEGFNHSGGPCLTQEPLNLGCSLQQYVTEVNTAGLCAFNDWRVPTRRELHSLISYRKAACMTATFFPSTSSPRLLLDFEQHRRRSCMGR